MSILSKQSLKKAFAPAVLTAALTTTGCATSGPSTIFNQGGNYQGYTTPIQNHEMDCRVRTHQPIEGLRADGSLNIPGEKLRGAIDCDSSSSRSRRVQPNRFEQVQDRSFDTMQQEIQRGINNSIRNAIRDLMP